MKILSLATIFLLGTLLVPNPVISQQQDNNPTPPAILFNWKVACFLPPIFLNHLERGELSNIDKQWEFELRDGSMARYVIFTNENETRVSIAVFAANTDYICVLADSLDAPIIGE